MADYSQLKVLEITGETAVEYVFEQVPGKPSIWLAPATDDNRDFFAARLILSAERANQLTKEAKARGGKSKVQEGIVLVPEDFDVDRESDRVLLARHCIKRWGTPLKTVDGKLPDMTPETWLDFLLALPNRMIDNLRGFAGNSYNFEPKVGDDFKLISDEAKDALGN